MAMPTKQQEVINKHVTNIFQCPEGGRAHTLRVVVPHGGRARGAFFLIVHGAHP